MNKDEIQKLIGGYATGSLTEEEQRILFEAALEDQELFDALQQEQPLKELFDDPFSREQVRRAAAESGPTARTPWFRRPWIWAMGASVAAAAVLAVGLTQWSRSAAPATKAVAEQPRQTSVAENRPAKREPAPPPKPDSQPKAVAKVEKHKLAKKEESPAPQLARAQPSPIESRSVGGRSESRGESIARATAPPLPFPPMQTPFRDQSQSTPGQVAPPAPQPANETQQSQDVVTRNGPPEKDQQSASGVVQSSTQQVMVTPVPAQVTDQQAATAEQTKQQPAAQFKASPALQRRASGASFSGLVAGSPSVNIMIEKKLEDGLYTSAPVNSLIPPGTTIRLIISPRIVGLATISESDAADPDWRRIFPPDQENAELKPFTNFTVPVEIIVKKGERLRVAIGSSITTIPIRTEDAK